MITRGEARGVGGGGFSTSRSFYLALINQNGQHSFYVLSISFNLVLVLAISVREIQRSEISDFACIILYVFCNYCISQRELLYRDNVCQHQNRTPTTCSAASGEGRDG